MKPLIAIIMPTIMRPDLIQKVLTGLKEYDFMLPIVIDQNPKIEYNVEGIHLIHVGHEIGLSACRNLGVNEAKELGIQYCLISADSILPTSDFSLLPLLTTYLDNYDLIGLNLRHRIGWEGDITLIPNQSFEIDFLDKTKEYDTYIQIEEYNNSNGVADIQTYGGIWKCSIVRNFFLAKTDALYAVPWDENLKMREHEDWFFRFKVEGYKVGCTDAINGKYIATLYKEGMGEYAKLRRRNMAEGLEFLMKKYNLKKWLTYKNYGRIQGC